MTKLAAENPTAYKPVRAPRGTSLSCKGWPQEAALRMLMNCLDPDVAERPEELIAHGGRGKAVRNWSCFHAIVDSLRNLENDETLLVQSGKPVGIFRTHSSAPRVLIANSNLAGRWNDCQHFDELDRAGLMMRGSLEAGAWLYTGSQGALHGTYETFAAAGRRHFGGELSGKLIVSGGMGGIGGAQPLAATLNGAAFLGVEIDPERIKRRIRNGYCDVMVNNLDEALRILKNAVRKREATSVGLIGNCADVIPELASRGVVPDLLTDQTSAHDPAGGYIPQGINVAQAAELRRTDPSACRMRALDSIARHVEGILALQKLGAVTFDFGNNIRTVAFEHGVKHAYDIPGFAPTYIRPMISEGRGPLRWVALSGEASDIRRTDDLILEMFSQDQNLCRWIKLMQERVRFQGLPSRACWIASGERVQLGLALNDLVARGEVKAPIVIGSDHLNAGSAASPFAETEQMPDASDAVADWPLLTALLNAASGASWVSIQNGGGVGIGYALHAGYAAVADGSKEMAGRIERILANDLGIGIARHADAGYPEAIGFARNTGLKLPMLDESS